MNYDCLKKYSREELTKFISHMTDNIRRCHKIGWLRGMDEHWQYGVDIANELLTNK